MYQKAFTKTIRNMQRNEKQINSINKNFLGISTSALADEELDSNYR